MSNLSKKKVLNRNKINNVNDIVVIGGGIAGLYICYKMRNKNKNISCFEMNDIMGGRIKTLRINVNGIKHTVDLGAGRYHKEHYLLRKLIKDLNLQDKEVTFGSQVNFQPTNNYHLKDKFKGINGFDMVKKVIEYYNKKKHSDNYLRKLSFPEYAIKVLTEDEIKFMLDSTGYYAELAYANAYNAIQMYKNDVRDDIKYCSLKGGLDQIISNIIQETRNKIDYYNNAVLTQVFYNDGIFVLNINNKKIITKKLILAIPKQSLMKLNIMRPYFPLLKSVDCQNLTRVYSFYDPKDVWFDCIGKTTTNNRLRYIIPISPKRGSIMSSYVDTKYAKQWKNVDKRKVNKIIRDNMDIIFNKKTKSPKYSYIANWECGVAHWLPGYNSDEISGKIIQPNTKLPLYVVGENYSKLQAWIEGSLQTSEECLKLIK